MSYEPLTRFRASGGDLENLVFTSYHINPTRYVDKSFVVTAKTDYYEEVTADVSGPRSKWKPFQHFKYWGDFPRVETIHTTGDYVAGIIDPSHPYYATKHKKDGLFGWSGSVPYGPTTGPDAFYNPSGSDFVSPPAELDSLVQVGLNTLLPQVKAELSLINSAIELKDIRNSVRKAILNVKSVNTLAKLSSSVKGLSLKSIVRSTASNYLETQFNILPLLSDIAAVRAAFKKHVAKVNSLVARSAKAQTRHFMATLDEHEDTIAVYGPYNLGYSITPRIYGDCYTQRWTYHSPSKFHMQLSYNFNYTEYQRENAHALALLDSLGVNLNPAIIWNALPWSFVVDWVFGISKYLSSFTMHHMEPQINIRQYLWSIKRQKRVLLLKTIGENAQGFEYTKDTPVGTLFEEAYRRHVGVPTVSSILSSGLTLKEVSLGAALAITAKRDPKTRK